MYFIRQLLFQLSPVRFAPRTALLLFPKGMNGPLCPTPRRAEEEPERTEEGVVVIRALDVS